MTRSPKTVKHIVGTLKRILDTAQDDQAIPSNPVVAGRRQHTTKRRVTSDGKAPFKHRPLTANQVASVRLDCPQRLAGTRQRHLRAGCAVRGAYGSSGQRATGFAGAGRHAVGHTRHGGQYPRCAHRHAQAAVSGLTARPRATPHESRSAASAVVGRRSARLSC